MAVAHSRLVRPAWASRALLAVVPLVAAALPAKAGGAYTPLYTFTGGADGAFPTASVTLDSAGNIYGEAAGGANLCPVPQPIQQGCGTVYRLSPAGLITTLVTFTGPNGAVGQGKPALVGNTLFGSTEIGGSANYGVIFSVNTDGSNFQLIHQFSGKEGSYPSGPLLATKTKLLYGTAFNGGPNSNQRNGDNGTLFEIHQNGSFTLLHAFNGHDGQYPNVIIMDASGTIFGSTHAGGTSNCYCGTIFSYVPSTKTFTTLYAFNNTSDGEFPALGSVGPDGTLYGVGTNGGKRASGTLFDLVPSGAGYMFHTLYKFGSGRGAGGAAGSAGPILLPNGALFGAGYNALYYFSTSFPKGVDPYTFSVSGPASQPVPGPGPGPTVYGTTVNSSLVSCLSSTGVAIGTSGCGMIYRESLGTPAP